MNMKKLFIIVGIAAVYTFVVMFITLSSTENPKNSFNSIQSSIVKTVYKTEFVPIATNNAVPVTCKFYPMKQTAGAMNLKFVADGINSTLRTSTGNNPVAMNKGQGFITFVYYKSSGGLIVTTITKDMKAEYYDNLKRVKYSGACKIA